MTALERAALALYNSRKAYLKYKPKRGCNYDDQYEDFPPDDETRGKR